MTDKHPADVLAEQFATGTRGAYPDTWCDPEAAAMLRTIPALEAERDELRAANEAFGKRQEWWNEKMLQLESERDDWRTRAEHDEAARREAVAERDKLRAERGAFRPIGWAVVGPHGKFHSGHCTREAAERRQKTRQQAAAEKGFRDMRSYVVPIYSTFTGEENESSD